MLYAPLGDEGSQRSSTMEFAKMLGDARRADAAAVNGILAQFRMGSLDEHRARVLDTALAVLDGVEALFPAMWSERMEGRLEIQDYRVMRDDFDLLKSRYQDIFELGSRALAFTARIANIGRRGDARRHADDTRLSFNEALNHTTAAKREAWLVDYPLATVLYSAMKRHTRNDIGHRLVQYDFTVVALRYTNGVSENYILFLSDYLHAVRLSQHLVEVVLVLWHASDWLDGGNA